VYDLFKRTSAMLPNSFKAVITRNRYVYLRHCNEKVLQMAIREIGAGENLFQSKKFWGRLFELEKEAKRKAKPNQLNVQLDDPKSQVPRKKKENSEYKTKIVGELASPFTLWNLKDTIQYLQLRHRIPCWRLIDIYKTVFKKAARIDQGLLRPSDAPFVTCLQQRIQGAVIYNEKLSWTNTKKGHSREFMNYTALHLNKICKNRGISKLVLTTNLLEGSFYGYRETNWRSWPPYPSMLVGLEVKDAYYIPLVVNAQDESHCCLFVCDNRSKTIQYYDPNGSLLDNNPNQSKTSAPSSKTLEKKREKLTASKDNVYHLEAIASTIADYFTQFLVGVEDKEDYSFQKGGKGYKSPPIWTVTGFLDDVYDLNYNSNCGLTCMFLTKSLVLNEGVLQMFTKEERTRKMTPQEKNKQFKQINEDFMEIFKGKSVNSFINVSKLCL